MAYGRDKSERESELIFAIPGKAIRGLYEERAKRHTRRAEMYDDAADKMAQAIAAAPKDEPETYLPDAERAYEGVRTLAVAQAPRQNSAQYRELARHEKRQAALASLCATGISDKDYNLTEDEVNSLYND